MKKIWQTILKCTLWGLAALYLCFTLMSIPHFSAIIALLAGLLVLPIKKWQDLLKRMLPRALKNIMAAVMCVLFFFLVPETAPVQKSDSTYGADAPIHITTTSTLVRHTTTTSATSSGETTLTSVATTWDTTTIKHKITTSESTTTATKTTTKKSTTIKQKTIKTTTKPTTNQNEQEQTYILNIDSKKFHYPNCRHVGNMKESNKQVYKGTREELLANEYSSCGTCKP